MNVKIIFFYMEILWGGDETEYLVNTCKKHNITYHIASFAKSEDDDNQALKEVLDMFERITPL